MFRSMFLSLILTMSLFAFAGNKADINSDQAVNATDSVVLTNILAGNIAIDNYDLYSVVVVAPQGGDFTSPVDAADWVATQTRDTLHRFVIALAPGTYYITRTINLPAYTSLVGQTPEQCAINQFVDSSAFPYGASVVCDNALFTSVENITFYKGDSTSSGSNTAIFVKDCTTVIRNCDITVSSGSAWSIPIWIYGATYNATAEVYDTRILATQGNSGHGTTACVYLQGKAFLDAHDTNFRSVNSASTGTGLSTVFYHYVSNSSNTIKLYQSTIAAYSTTTDADYYYYRDGSNGWAYFFYCQLLAGGSNIAPTDNTMKFIYCNDGANPFP